MPRKPAITSRLRKIKLLLLDVDGVMTDGGIYLSNSGDEFKKSTSKMEYGIVKLQRAGIKVGIITGRVSNIVTRRAEELGISEVHQNLENKLEVYEHLKTKWNLSDSEIAYIGDDEFDLRYCIASVFSAAPSDAIPV